MPLRILVIDDEELVCRMMRRILEPEHDVVTADNGEEAIRFASSRRFDLIFCDIRMRGLDGFAVLQKLRETLNANTEIIMMTSHGNLTAVWKATDAGASDFILKPFTPDQIKHLVSSAEERKAIRPATEPLEVDTASEIIGASPAIIEIFKQALRIAPSNLAVTIYGESGTGKELIARLIHRHSQRASQPFIAVNCGALTETLLESELFGHTRGAFTGAVVARRGLFEEATGGTLFLDEISETSLTFQVKLLRALQEGEIKPVGASHSVKVDVRVLVASNRDLQAAVDAGQFRQDLLYRINVVTLQLPPLRERREDILRLIQHFAQMEAITNHRQISFSPEALEMLTNYDWPGNVRQLQNAVQRVIAFSTSGLIVSADLPPEIREYSPLGQPKEIDDEEEALVSIKEIERRHLLKVLAVTHGNKLQTARILNIDRNTVDRLVKTHGIDVSEFKQ